MKELTDQKDIELLNARMEAYNSRREMSVGDVIRFTDGKTMRVAYIWNDRVQPCWGGSFHMFSNGNCSMSGSLDSAIPTNELKPTNERATATAWFFHHDFAGADMGRDFTYRARVWNIDRPSPRKFSETYYLTQVTSEWARERTCGNYHYLVTRGGSSHVAFEKEDDFLAWLDAHNLSLTEELAPRGEHKSQRLEVKS